MLVEVRLKEAGCLALAPKAKDICCSIPIIMWFHLNRNDLGIVGPRLHVWFLKKPIHEIYMGCNIVGIVGWMRTMGHMIS